MNSQVLVVFDDVAVGDRIAALSGGFIHERAEDAVEEGGDEVV